MKTDHVNRENIQNIIQKVEVLKLNEFVKRPLHERKSDNVYVIRYFLIKI